MNFLRTTLTNIVRPIWGSPLLNVNIARTVTQKPPGKRPDLAAKKAAVVVPATFVPYHLRPRAPTRNEKGRKKRMHPTAQPKVNWIIDRTIPRTSVLSYNPLASHRWHDWRMLRDVKRRAYVQRDNRVRTRLKALLRTKCLPEEFREFVRDDIVKLPRDSNIVRLNNRCVITSRPRSVLTKYRMSRIAWRNLADHNLISGCLRAKWGNLTHWGYYEHIAPDYHGTLCAEDPMFGRTLGPLKHRLNKIYRDYEDSYNRSRPFGARNKRITLPSELYNENIFKEEPFVYPPNLTDPAPIIIKKRKIGPGKSSKRSGLEPF